MKKVSLLACALFLLTGCGQLCQIAPQYNLPIQSLHAQRQKGNTRVFFYNTSLPPATILNYVDNINIVLDNKNIGSIRAREYIVVNLEPKEYELNLTHYDVFKFSNTYKLSISGKDMFVNVYNGIFSTKYKLKDQLSPNFESWFKPAYNTH